MGAPASRAAPALLLLLLLATSVSAGEAVLEVPAVSDDGAGVLVRMQVTAAPGTGLVSIEGIDPPDNTTLAAAVEAIAALRTLPGLNPDALDVVIAFDPQGPLVAGPSAGLAIAGGVAAAVQGWVPAQGVYVTGGIGRDGSVRPAGGILAKARAVALAGGHTLLIPPDQGHERVTVPTGAGDASVVVDLAGHAADQWGLVMVEVTDLATALAYLNGTRGPERTVRPAPPDLSLVSADPLQDLAFHLIDIARVRADEVAGLVPAKLGDEPTGPRLKSGRDMVDQARNKVAMNATYLGANDAFQALVDMELLSMLAAYAATADPEGLMVSWRERAEAEIIRANGTVPHHLLVDTGALEWVLSAQLRIAWARAHLRAAGDDPLDVAYATAGVHAWSIVVTDLARIAVDRATGDILQLEQERLVERAQQLQGLLVSHVALGHAIGTDLHGAEAHLLSSPLLTEQGLYLAALVDASLGLARIEAGTANSTIAQHEVSLLVEALDGLGTDDPTVYWARAMLQASRDSSAPSDTFLHARTARVLIVLPRTAMTNTTYPADLLPPEPTLPPDFHRRAWGRLEQRFGNRTRLPDMGMGTRRDRGRGLAVVGAVAALLFLITRTQGTPKKKEPSQRDVRQDSEVKDHGER
ncbi:MAG: S16 family serine protease [Methanopyri archaeon]|nr:S16 family serine protease [Methanopyri archaeon]